MPELGKIKQVEDLPKIWPNETRDFTVLPKMRILQCLERRSELILISKSGSLL